MLQQDLINQFLSNQYIAVVGVSRKGDIPANYIFKKFKSAGYQTYPVNPNAETVEGEKCYPDLMSLPDQVESVFLAGPPEASAHAIDDCAKVGASIVWMHQGIGNGSYSSEANDKCKAHGIHAITNGCPMMFIKPVDPFHRVLRWVKKI